MTVTEGSLDSPALGGRGNEAARRALPADGHGPAVPAPVYPLPAAGRAADGTGRTIGQGVHPRRRSRTLGAGASKDRASSTVFSAVTARRGSEARLVHMHGLQCDALGSRSCSTWVRVGHGAPTAAAGITGRVPRWRWPVLAIGRQRRHGHRCRVRAGRAGITAPLGELVQRLGQSVLACGIEEVAEPADRGPRKVLGRVGEPGGAQLGSSAVDEHLATLLTPPPAAGRRPGRARSPRVSTPRPARSGRCAQLGPASARRRARRSAAAPVDLTIGQVVVDLATCSTCGRSCAAPYISAADSQPM